MEKYVNWFLPFSVQPLSPIKSQVIGSKKSNNKQKQKRISGQRVVLIDKEMKHTKAVCIK